MSERLTDDLLLTLRADFVAVRYAAQSSAPQRDRSSVVLALCDELIARRAADAHPAPDVDAPGDAMTDWLCDLAEQTNATHTRGVDAQLLKMQREGE